MNTTVTAARDLVITHFVRFAFVRSARWRRIANVVDTATPIVASTAPKVTTG